MLGFALALHSGINCSWQGVGEAYGMLGLNQDSHVQGEQPCLLTIALVPMPSTLDISHAVVSDCENGLLAYRFILPRIKNADSM